MEVKHIELQSHFDKLHKELSELDREIEKIKNQIADGHRQIDSFGKDLSKQEISQMEETLTADRKKLRSLQTKRTKTRDKLKALEIENQNKIADGIEAEIRTLRERKEVIRKTELPETEIKLQNLKEEIQQIDNRISELNKHLKAALGTRETQEDIH